jgi:hypothetical protein
MSADSRLSRADLDEIERRARRFSDRQWRRADTGGVERYALSDEEGGEIAHLYARRELGDMDAFWSARKQRSTKKKK